MFHIIFDEQVTFFFLITRIVFDKSYLLKTIQRNLYSTSPIKICFTKSNLNKENIKKNIYIYIYSCQRKASLGGKNKNIYVFLVTYLI